MKTAIALAALLGVGTAPALAGGFYTNVESNASYTGSDFTTRTTDLHLGYEGSPTESLNYYIQGGPAVVAVDGADSDTQLSGKLGANIAATDKLDLYGEISLLTQDGDVDNSYGTKLGAKYKF
jgi:outer membrane autotransporter protein